LTTSGLSLINGSNISSAAVATVAATAYLPSNPPIPAVRLHFYFNRRCLSLLIATIII
jgi:hypothetical protein